jgi:hypothetical protein
VLKKVKLSKEKNWNPILTNYRDRNREEVLRYTIFITIGATMFLLGVLCA